MTVFGCDFLSKSINLFEILEFQVRDTLKSVPCPMRMWAFAPGADSVVEISILKITSNLSTATKYILSKNVQHSFFEKSILF